MSEQPTPGMEPQSSPVGGPSPDATIPDAGGDPYVTRVPDTEPTVESPQPRPATELPRMAGYEVLEELGRGGMGVVYKARQKGLNRLVAIKMILAGIYASPAQLRRFQAEAEAAAQLQHPNIVGVHEIGEWRAESMGAPVPYFSLEYVEGGSLDRFLMGTPLPPREAALLVEVLARAVQAAHDHGIVHRDLKPANILLAQVPGLPTSGRRSTDGAAALTTEQQQIVAVPKIADFGLAKQVNTDSGTTRPGEVIGTPSYMAPEQASGDSRAAGLQADVYSLGAILYECLTGRPPFRAPTAVATICQLLVEDPVPVVQLQAGTSRDLDTICLKCLEKDPARRYSTAQALADDLHRFLRGDPIRARPPTVAYVARKFVLRHRGKFLAAAAILLVGIVGLIAAFVQIDHARDVAVAAQVREAAALQRVQGLLDESELKNQRLAEQQEALQRRLAMSYLQSGQSDCLHFELGLGLSSLLAAYEAAPPNDPLRTSIRRLMAGWEPELFPRVMHDGEIEAVGFLPGGREIFTAGRDGAVRFWDVAAGKQQGAELRPGGPIWSAVLAPGAGQLLATGTNHGVVLWDLATRKPLGEPLAHPGRVLALAFSPDDRLLATGCTDGRVRLWDTATQLLQGEPLVHADQKAVAAVAFNPDGTLLATGGDDSHTRLWNPLTGQPAARPIVHESPVWSLAFHPDGKQLFIGEWGRQGRAGVGRMFELASLKPASDALIRGPENEGFLAAAFNADGTLLFTGDSDNNSQLWDGRTLLPLGNAIRHERSVRAVAFAPDGKSRATGSRDGKVRLILDRPAGKPLLALRHPQGVLALAATPDGSRAATGCADGRARLWEIPSGKLLCESMLHDGPVTAVAFADDGKLLLTGGKDGRLGVWEAFSGQPRRPAITLGEAISSLASVPSSSLVLVGGQDRGAWLMDYTTGQTQGVKMLHDQPVLAVAVLPGPQGWFATGGVDRLVKFWDRTNCREAAGTLQLKDGVLALAVTVAGDRLVTGSADNKGALWDLNSRKPLHEFKDDLGHGRNVTAVAVSPDGALILTGGEDAATRIWDAMTGYAVGLPHKYESNVRCLTFLPEGRGYLVGRDSGIVELLRVPEAYPDQPERLAAWIAARTMWKREGAVHRGLTTAEWQASWETVERLSKSNHASQPTP